MMNTPVEEAMTERGGRAGSTVATKKNTYRNLVTVWILLIFGGLTLAYFYTNYMKNQIAKDIAAQTSAQLKVVQDNYKQQVDQLRTDVQGEIAAMESKVGTLGELLAFTKDSANAKTDNSNQLYTQLSDLKKQLDELKANLDVLK
jgi:hypothetical protein